MAAHFLRSTACWWRADKSDSPPGGKACQYCRFFSRQGWAKAAVAHTLKAASTERMLKPKDMGLSSLNRRANGACDLLGAGLPAQIAGVQSGVGGGLLNRSHQGLSRLLLAQVLQ